MYLKCFKKYKSLEKFKICSIYLFLNQQRLYIQEDKELKKTCHFLGNWKDVLELYIL